MARVQDSRTSALYFRVESMALEGRAFAGEYAAYVIFRASHFSPGFAELTRLGGGGGEEGEGPMGPREAAVTLERLQETLRRALLVRLQMDEVTEVSTSDRLSSLVCSVALLVGHTMPADTSGLTD